MPGLVQSKATVSLDVLGGLEAAPTARHPLYDLYRLAILVLGYVAYVDEALIAAVGCLLGENFGGSGAYT